MKNIYEEIKNFQSTDEQEEADRNVMLQEIEQQGEQLLDRENEAHFTSSAFIVNANRDKVLMVHHNLRDTWSWPGGHADGRHDLEANARKEIWEETGIKELTLVGGGIASLDLFHVPAHMKHGRPVEAHRHFSVAYIYEADERQPLRVCPEENSKVEWLDADRIREPLFSREDVRLYRKLLERSQSRLNCLNR